MAHHITTGIDIGTYHVKVVVAEHARGREKRIPRILGTGIAESRGLRHGYIINAADAIKSIRSAVAQAEKTSQTNIKSAYLSVGGVSLDEIRSRGEAVTSRADSEVTDMDLEKALAHAEERATQKLTNRKILHAIPISYTLDGERLPPGTRPVGLKGSKLDVEVLFISSFEQHLNDLIQAVEEAGVEVDDVMAAPIAASLVVLTKAQKIAGCVLANIGAETVSVAVFEDNVPISLKVFPIGSTDITNDIALGLKVPLEEAERIKLGAITRADYTNKELADIIATRLRDMLALIETHLKKLGKDGLLPAGIVITGGGSGITTIEDVAKAALRLPSAVGAIQNIRTTTTNSKERMPVRDSSWAVAYGLCLWGSTAGEGVPLGITLVKKTGNNLLSWIRQFLP